MDDDNVYTTICKCKKQIHAMQKVNRKSLRDDRPWSAQWMCCCKTTRSHITHSEVFLDLELSGCLVVVRRYKELWRVALWDLPLFGSSITGYVTPWQRRCKGRRWVRGGWDRGGLWISTRPMSGPCPETVATSSLGDLFFWNFHQLAFTGMKMKNHAPSISKLRFFLRKASLISANLPHASRLFHSSTSLMYGSAWH